MLELTKIPFESLEKSEDYFKFFESLKQKILFFIHLNYTDEEILGIIKDLKLTKVVISDIIPSYIEKVRKKNRGIYVNELDKNILLKMWFERFLDFGKKGEYKHYSDLLIFQFQIDAIKNLLTEFNPFLKGEVKQIIDKILLNLYTNKYKGFKKLLIEYYKMFGVKILLAKIPNQAHNSNIIGVPNQRVIMDFKFPEDEKFQVFFGQKKDRPIVKFISQLRLIILGGQKSQYRERYVPFFMDKKATVESIKSYMTNRLNAVIKQYYQRFLKRKKIPANFKDSEMIEAALNLPIINLTAFNYIDWDFMPERYFYDGVCVQKPLKNSSIYTIQTHPLNLFLCYFFKDEFEIFLDQLLHHEFIHLLQYRVSYIYDKLLSREQFKRTNLPGYKLLFNLASTHWINELKTRENPKGYDPTGRFKSMESYIMSQGGHTWRFMQEVNKFKNCRRAMTVRGRVETLYAGMFYLTYASNQGSGYWYLCKPDSSESQSPASINLIRLKNGDNAKSKLKEIGLKSKEPYHAMSLKKIVDEMDDDNNNNHIYTIGKLYGELISGNHHTLAEEIKVYTTLLKECPLNLKKVKEELNDISENFTEHYDKYATENLNEIISEMSNFSVNHILFALGIFAYDSDNANYHYLADEIDYFISTLPDNCEKISKTRKKSQKKLMRIRILEPTAKNWYSIRKRSDDKYYIAKEGSKGSTKFVFLDIGDIDEPGIQGIAFLRGVPKKAKLKIGTKIKTEDWKSQAIRIEYKVIKSNALEDPELQISKALKKYSQTIIEFLEDEYPGLSKFKILPKNDDFRIELYGYRTKLKSKELIKLNSITIEDENAIDIKKGNVYLGRDVEDEGVPGYTTIKEIEETLEEIEVDYTNTIIDKKTSNSRLMRLALIVVKCSKKDENDNPVELAMESNKIIALEKINEFREKIGFNTLDIEDYLKSVKHQINNVSFDDLIKLFSADRTFGDRYSILNNRILSMLFLSFPLSYNRLLNLEVAIEGEELITEIERRSFLNILRLLFRADDIPREQRQFKPRFEPYRQFVLFLYREMPFSRPIYENEKRNFKNLINTFLHFLDFELIDDDGNEIPWYPNDFFEILEIRNREKQRYNKLRNEYESSQERRDE